MAHSNTYLDLALGLAAVGLAVFAQGQVGAMAGVWVGVIYGTAALLVVIATRRQRDIGLGEEVQGRLAPSRVGPWGLLLLVAALAIGGLSLWRVNPDHPTGLLWILHLGSVLLFFAAAYVLDQSQMEPDSQDGAPDAGWPRHLLRPWSRLDWLLAGGILVLGLFMRFRLFFEWPRGLWFDEALYGLQALRILKEPGFWPIYSSTAHTPAHYLYLIALSFATWEVSPAAIRLASVLLGLATIPAGYLVGRELFGRRVGLVMALFMAVSRWNVNFSRIGMENITTPLFALLTVGLLLRALRRARYLDYALAGFCLGLGLNFYEAFQLFVGVIGLFGLHLVLVNRRLLRDHWRGIGVMAAGVLLLVTPLLYFAYQRPEIYFTRTRDTSLFAEFAGPDRWPALWENARKHLLMFNGVGDPNGRHNLPGEPMLDPIAGALMVLGLAVALARFYRPRSLLLPLWMVVMLSASIFSLSFEAPQSLRGIGTLPAAYLLAAVPISGLWRIWDETQAGRRYPRLFVWPVLTLLALVTYLNYQTYFHRQIRDFAVWNAFSTPETIAAEILAAESDTAQVNVISLYHNHPTLQFIARDVADYPRLETSDHLPLSRPADRDLVLVMDIERRPLYDQARRFYPGGTFREYQPPVEGPAVVYYARLTPEDISSIQGLNVSYFAGPAGEGDPVVSRRESRLDAVWPQDAPLSPPFSARWEGVLDVPAYGPYRLLLTAPATAVVAVDRAVVMEGAGALAADLVLARGKHSLTVEAEGGDGPIRLAWKRPNLPEEIIAPTALYVAPVAANGLLGRYFPNANWQPPEAFAQIDPQLNLYFHITPLPRPYSVTWEGKLLAPLSGPYTFGIESIDEAELMIDGQTVAESPEPNQYGEGRISLEAGPHDVRVRFVDRTDHTHINLFWQPPGRALEPVPAVALLPPQGSYDDLDAEMVALLESTVLLPADSGAALQTRPADYQVTVVRDGLDRVRGIALGDDGRLFVIQPQRLLILEDDGTTVVEHSGAGTPFVDLSDVAVRSDGLIYVLDAGVPQLAVFSPQGSHIRNVPAPVGVLGVARGLATDGAGRLWVAVTSAGSVVGLNPDGQPIARYPVQVSGATDAQPVDVVVGPMGELYVTDVGNRRLVHLDPNGQTLSEWPIPGASSIDGPHLALAGDGTLFVTQPEQGSVLEIQTDTGEISEQLLPASDVPAKAVGIAVSPDGSQIWVADSHYGRILRIDRVSPPPP